MAQKGRMGKQVVHAVQAQEDLLLVGQAEKADQLSQIIEETTPDVVVDFTLASVAFKNAQAIIDANVHPVIGTSGLMPEDVMQLQQQCQEKSLGGIIAPNFSLGIVMMIQCAKKIAHYFPQAEIIESHDVGKQDSPSGTALATAQAIEAGRQSSVTSVKGHETVLGARGAVFENTPIHAVRLSGLLAQQQVLFGGEDETLTLTHNTLTRASFMPGVLLACRHVVTLNELVYGLEHLL